jgi:hypothetical protein
MVNIKSATTLALCLATALVARAAPQALGEPTLEGPGVEDLIDGPPGPEVNGTSGDVAKRQDNDNRAWIYYCIHKNWGLPCREVYGDYGQCYRVPPEYQNQISSLWSIRETYQNCYWYE